MLATMAQYMHMGISTSPGVSPIPTWRSPLALCMHTAAGHMIKVAGVGAWDHLQAAILLEITVRTPVVYRFPSNSRPKRSCFC